MIKVNYNERSWAIDLISEINLWLVGKSLLIKRAGGENTLKAKNKVLFPDVLLFGDDSQGKILQGWELKMPDTPINDIEFINNAKTKALNLSLNSFLLWNVSSAALYILEGNVPKLIKVWNNLFDIRDRSVVASVKDKIKIIIINEGLPAFFRKAKKCQWNMAKFGLKYRRRLTATTESEFCLKNDLFFY